MKFSEAWLREWVNPEVDTNELSDQLSMAGLEVDGTEPAAAAFNGVVVGEVLTREQHPNADKLSVCTVNTGSDEPAQIVCGARNVAAGMRVPVATVGARLPGDFKIKKAKLRGVQSLGMICSASELGLAESSDGIMPLPGDAPIGTDVRQYLSLEDTCIEVDLTPDRGDCLSMAGIAREVAVINRAALSQPEIADVPAQIDDTFPVELLAPQACPRYLARVIRGIDATAETPQWMVEKLRRGDVRAISPVVDVTNFVLLELGQPMHGFDLANLSGGIRVRMAEAGEELTLLDGNDVELRSDTLVIADHDKVLAIAGIMGGEGSGVADDSGDILLEAAFFAPLAITGRARSYGLHTDSSHRFERGVDFNLPHKAMQRATALLLDIVGGQAGPINEIVDEAQLPARPPVSLRRQRVSGMLGVEIDDTTIVDIMQRLGTGVETVDDGWLITPPSGRFDLNIEADLIEEIGRIYGYANIPASLSSAPVSISLRPEAEFVLDSAKQTLVERDYQEAITYSFISPEMADLLTPGAEHITLANPISTDMSVMRGSIWPGLLTTLQYNLARQQDRVRIFESGLTFVRTAGKLQQVSHLAAIICGTGAVEQWAESTRKVDFYDIKGDLEAVLGQVASLNEFTFEAAENPALHPGQTARVLRNGQAIGWVGLLHPALQAKLSLPGNVFLFDIDLAGLKEGEIPAFETMSKFPAIRRDFAIVVTENISWQAILDVAHTASSAIVKDIQLFDVYTGDNIDSGLKSLALSLILQESSHTLTDQEVEEASGLVLDALAVELSAKLRE